MQYLLMDTHRRLLGTLNSSQAFSIGDIVQAERIGTCAVIGLDWNGIGRSESHSLTVIPIHPLESPLSPLAAPLA